jgi:5-methyltetrahydrofolate--homocysteine methyltransferase
MASFVPQLIKAGANIIGGCCGTTPEHIRRMAKIITDTTCPAEQENHIEKQRDSRRKLRMKP